MDILAHGLWTNVLFRALPKTGQDKKTTRWGIFFGVAPDLVAFGPLFLLGFYDSLFRGEPFLAGPGTMDNSPIWHLTLNLYNFTHSLVILGIVLLFFYFIRKKFSWPLLGWALHVSVDIFSHTSQFFATPFLFPVSSFKISVISWADPRFMLINYSLLLIFYWLVVPRLKQKTNLYQASNQINKPNT